MCSGKRNANGTREDEKACGDASSFAKATADREAATREGEAEIPSAESHPPPRSLHALPPHLYKSGGNSVGGVSGTGPVKIR